MDVSDVFTLVSDGVAGARSRRAGVAGEELENFGLTYTPPCVSLCVSLFDLLIVGGIVY